MFKIGILTFNKTHTNPETKNIHQIKHQKPAVTFGKFQNQFIPKKKNNHKHIFLASNNINNKLKSSLSKEK
jgi:hypothetical protein